MTQTELEEGTSHTLLTVRLITYQPIRSYQTSHYSTALLIPFDFFYGFCINDTDLQEITKTEVGITKTEVVNSLLLYKYKSLTIYLNRPSDSFQKLQWIRSLMPRWSLTPSLLRSYVWVYPGVIVFKSCENTEKYVDAVTLFQKTWMKKVIDS